MARLLQPSLTVGGVRREIEFIAKYNKEEWKFTEKDQDVGVKE
jgi:hypothetical protein